MGEGSRSGNGPRSADGGARGERRVVGVERRGEEDEAAVLVLSGEEHALAVDAFEAACGEVGDEAYLCADEGGRVGVALGDAADDGARVGRAVVDRELEQFVGLRDLGALEDGADTDVETGEVVERDGVLERGGLPGVELVLLTCGEEFVDLGLDGSVVDRLEEEFGLSERGAGEKDVGCASLVPEDGAVGEREHTAEGLSGEGEKRFGEDGEVGADLEGEVEDCGGALWVGLEEFPRFGVGKVLIAEACEVHKFGDSLAEAESLDRAADAFGEGGELVDDGGVEGVVERERGRDDAVEELVGEDEGAVDEIAEDGDELAIIL